MSKLSALIVVHNEAAILEACLGRLAFADELVVVLDRCTDGSKAIAEKFNAHTVEGAWPLEADRRHAGIDACEGPWILEIDADEWVSPALAAEITGSVTADDADFYFQPMHNYVGTRWHRTQGEACSAKAVKPGGLRPCTRVFHFRVVGVLIIKPVSGIISL
jgi:glycosyltransferase involved in cell wall biosynthesis